MNLWRVAEALRFARNFAMSNATTYLIPNDINITLDVEESHHNGNHCDDDNIIITEPDGTRWQLTMERLPNGW